MHIYGLSQEKQDSAALATVVAHEVTQPHAAEIDAQARFPREAVSALGERGLLGHCVSQELGGKGQGPRALQPWSKNIRCPAGAFQREDRGIPARPVCHGVGRSPLSQADGNGRRARVGRAARVGIPEPSGGSHRRWRAMSSPGASSTAAVAVDGGDLPLGGGLLALVRPALELLEPGGVLAILSRARPVAEDLPAWCTSSASSVS